MFRNMSDSALAPVERLSTDALFVEVYQRLKAMASSQLSSNRAGATFDTTALVHDVYLRMTAHNDLSFERQAQFFAYAARAMRSLLTDHARQRLSMKGGGDWIRVTISGNDEQYALESAERVLELEEAIKRLEDLDERAARVVELRYFAGLTLEQVAETMTLARRTVDRDWRFARAFLQIEMG
jgi:RNA polymerase sigma factor (TIGR02999 family)